MRYKLAAAVGALAVAVLMAAPALAKGPRVELEFLGQAIVPTGATFQGTTVGGLSSITFDPERGVFYALSDDPSQFSPARFYTVALDLGDGHLNDGDVAFQGVATLLAPGDPPNRTRLSASIFQDGPAATIAGGSPARIIRYNLRTRRLDRQWIYQTDPVAEPPVPANQFSVSGLVELLPLNNRFLIAMERSFSVGAPGTGNTIRIYQAALPGAGGGMAEKTLLLDLEALGIPLDNVEGMTFGPRLPDGRRSIVLVSDNNFAPSQFTQFLLFAAGYRVPNG